MPKLYIGNREVAPAIIKAYNINNQDKTITENGVYTADLSYTGLGEVTVNVPPTQPVIRGLDVSPSTMAQTITVPSGVDGYSPINVAAVTSSIDSNITAGNIKKNVQILGVTGTVEELKGETKVITPTTSQQTITPSSGKNAITQATIEAVTSSIDSNITAGNIKKNVQILGVTGTLEEGITPTGTINIVENGTVDVTNYASASVNVPNVGIPREVSSQGVYEMPTSNFTFSLPSNVVDVGLHAIDHAFQFCSGVTSVDLSNLTNLSGNYGMAYAFEGCRNIISVDLSNLTNLSGNNGMYYAFDSCNSITSVNLSSLSTISGNYGMAYAFYSCLGITSVDLPSLSTISGSYGMYYAFNSCNRITSVNLSSLSTISGNYGMFHTFTNCPSIVSVDLSSLSTISGSFAMYYAFSSCTSLTSLSFPALTSNSFGSYTNQFNNMLYSVTGCTVHFPSNLQSVIGSWSDVTAGFGGTNTTVLFDLPATE